MYFHLIQLLLISNPADARLVCIPVSSLPSTLQHHHSEMKPNVPRSPTGACLLLFSNISISFRNLAPSAFKWYIFCSEHTSHPDTGWTFSILITVTPALTCIRLGVAVLFMHPRAPPPRFLPALLPQTSPQTHQRKWCCCSFNCKCFILRSCS